MDHKTTNLIPHQSFFGSMVLHLQNGEGAHAFIICALCTSFQSVYQIYSPGAIYSGLEPIATNISLTNGTFSHNTAAYCGVMDVDEFNHCYVNLLETLSLTTEQ